jgi:hypothetical protein
MSVLCFVAFVLTLIFVGSQEHEFVSVEEIRRAEKAAIGPPP